MRFLPFSSSVKTMDAAQAKEWAEGKTEGSYVLLDVRQPAEYADGHIPGAVLVPLSDLPERMAELDRGKPVLAYCRTGARSLSAARLLTNHGFEAFSLTGGIEAWNGAVSRARAGQGMHLIEGDEEPTDALVLAYGLELGAQRFYRELSIRVDDAETSALFQTLADVEVRHGDLLWERYRALGGTARTRSELENLQVDRAMEGGLSPDQVLARAAPVETALEALELALAIELDSLDLYLRLAQASREPGSREVFFRIARDEKKHLERLGKMVGDPARS